MAGKVASRADFYCYRFAVPTVSKESDVVIDNDEGETMAVSVAKRDVTIIPHLQQFGFLDSADFLPTISAKAGALLLQPSADL